jgi:hypothetical protein
MVLVTLDLRGCYLMVGELCVDGAKPPVAYSYFAFCVSVLLDD